MAEQETQAVDTTTETATAQAAAANTQAPLPAVTEQANDKPEMTLEDALRELKSVRAEAAKYRTSAKAIEKSKAEAEEAALKEQGKFKQLYEKAQSDLKAKTDELTNRDRAEMQRKVAEKHGLKPGVAKFITGETEIEMDAAAAELREGMPGQALGNDAKKGVNSTAPTNYGGLTKEELASVYGVDVKYIK